MSTAGLSWSDKTLRHWRAAKTWLALVCMLWPPPLRAQATDAIASANQQKAYVVLAATIQALGGSAWLHLRTKRSQVRIASFFQGTPTGEVSEATVAVELPGVDLSSADLSGADFSSKERIDFDKGHVVQIFSGGSGWEITYKGKKSLPAEKLESYLRWRKDSLGIVLRGWYQNPATVLIDQGPSQVARHPAEKITLINAANDAVTLDIDAESHLPLRLSFAWRDPQFHDKNLDAVEYDNYHRIDGIATPFTMTRTHNGQIVYQSFVLRVEYNVALRKDLFDPNQVAAHLK